MCHAEEMCLLKLNDNKNDTKITKDTCLFITSVPCSTCTRLIILSGIKNVIYPENSVIGSHWVESCNYNELMFKDSNINLIKVSGIYEHDGTGHCINCNLTIDPDKKLCNITHCSNNNIWHSYKDNKEDNISIIIKKRKYND